MSEPPLKKFRYTTFTQKIKDITVDVGKTKGLTWEKEEFGEDVEQTSTPFTVELARLSLLDLTLPYQALQKSLIPLTSTLPITLLNLDSISSLFTNYFSTLQDGKDHLVSGLESALYLLQALYETCLGETLPNLVDTTSSLLRVGALRALDPRFVERTYSTLSLVLRTIASSLLKPDPSAQATLTSVWTLVRPYLRTKDNKPYVRKCVADAWSGVVRKARGEGSRRLLEIMLQGDAEGMEAVWANSMKGIPGHLHSRALPIFDILLERLRAEPSEERLTTINLLVTAMVHHCTSSTIAPLVESVTSHLEIAPSTDPSSSKSGLSLSQLPSSTVILNVLSTILLVRKGKRFPEPLLKPTMLKLVALLPHLSLTTPAIPMDEHEREHKQSWRRALTACVAGTLQAGHLAEWLSPGVTLIEGLWQRMDVKESYAFVNILVSMKWPGVEQFVLSHIARTALPNLVSDPLTTLVVINNLSSAGFLSGGLANVQGGRWRQSLISALVHLMSGLTDSDLDVTQRRILGQLLQLLPYFASESHQFGPQLVTMITRASQSSEASVEDNWRTAGAWNDAHLLAALLRCGELVQRQSEQVEKILKECLVDSGRLLEILRIWHWSREILGCSAPLVELWKSEVHLSGELVDILIPNLLSADSFLRASTLRILASTASTTSITKSDDISVSHSDIWNACLQVETSEMTLKNVRERTAAIAALSRMIASLPSTVDARSETIVQGVITYLIAQLKVNFRPLYAETISALASLVNVRGQAIWERVWSELEKTTAAKETSAVDIETVNPDWCHSKTVQISSSGQSQEGDKLYQCHNLEKARVILLRAWNQSTVDSELDEEEISSQVSSDRLDVLNYETQLLATLTAAPAIAERHSRALIPVFLDIARHADDDEDDVGAHLSTRQRQQRTASYLELLAKFVNPKAAFRSDELHTLYLEILSKGETKLQGLALKCLMTFKSPKLLPYRQSLEALLEEAKFRDELAHFTLGVMSEIIDPQHRDEIIPVTIRLLYGIITTRRGKTSSAQGSAARKQAVLTALSGCNPVELGTLTDLMLEPFGQLITDEPSFTVSEAFAAVAGRQQLGFLTLLQDVVRYLGPQTSIHWPKLVGTTINLVHNAQQRIGQETVDAIEVGDEEEVEEVELDKGTAPLKSIRSLGIKRLVQFFRSATEFDFSRFLPALFASVISPRVGKLDIENTQAPSGILELIAALAASEETAPSLVAFDSRVLPQTFACMTAIRVKPTVIARVFDIIDSLLIDESEAVAGSLTEQVLIPHIHSLLHSIIGLVSSLHQSGTSDDLMRRLLAILSRLSAVVTDGEQAQQLAMLLGPMLRQTGKQMPERAKTNILSTLQRLYAISPEFADPASKFFTQNYQLVSNLFQNLYTPACRRALCTVLETFVQTEPSLQSWVRVTSDINAYSSRRLEEPDFDRRLAAFALLNDAEENELPTDVQGWLPILRSVLFFIQEPEELSIRSNASSVLQRFMTIVGPAEEGPFVDTLLSVILPGLRRSLRNKNELVRNEVLQVINHGVKTCIGVPVLAEMKPLLADGDDEANFFVNVCHIQVHRRARAIRRLGEVCAASKIREVSISTIFLPVLEHIIAGATDVTDHHLTNESIATVGSLAGCLRWPKYNGLIMRYLKLGTPKTSQQKFFIRTVSAIIDHFHFDLSLSAAKPMEIDGEEEVEGGGAESEGEGEAIESIETTSTERVTTAILSRLLPALSKFVSQNGETEDHIRIPVALGVVKIASALPGASSANEISRILTTVSQILRSKDQGTRDIARETICKIAVYLGPDWLVQVLKELRGALQRGPQKHVLAVVTHAILALATTESSDKFGNLDDAVEDAVQISAEVVWGDSGKDVHAEGFKTKMREVRGASSRGYDTFQLVARLVSPTKIGAVLAPIRDVMHVSQAVKTMLNVNEALRRVALGLNANPRIGPEDLLTLCFSLVSGNSKYLQAKKKAPKASRAADTYRVQLKRDVEKDVDIYALNAYKFVAFGLDLFVTAFRRGRFDFDSVDILARLGPLVNAIGNTLYSPTSSVLVLGLKASAAIAKCPLPQMDEALPVIIVNIFKIIKNAGGTAESEVAQTALKTLAVIIRDCKSSEITEKQLKYLLEVISPDIEEPDRQGAIFTILRGIIMRRFVVPEIYDLMDRVSSIMVTSQSTHVQELCRGALMQFLLDYPQGQGRLKAQMTFLARNLDYIFESGRVSVMEVLSTIFAKFSDELVQEYADLFFVALVVVIANDDSEKCRMMAGALIQQLFSRLEARQQQKMLQVLHAWVGTRDSNAALANSSLAVYGMLVEGTEGVTEDSITTILSDVGEILQQSAELLAEAESSTETFPEMLDHNLPQRCLSVLSKALQSHSDMAETMPWEAITQHLLFPHDWVRYGAAKALAVLFSTRPPTADHTALAILGDDALLAIAKKSCILLKGSVSVDGENVIVDGKLADQLVKLLWNISKYWASSEVDIDVEQNAEEEEDHEDGPAKGRPLSWLMSRMSFLARHLIVNRPPSHSTLVSRERWIAPVMSILRFFAGVYEHLNETQAKHFLLHILSPIYRILDDGGDLTSADTDGQIDEMRQLATEVRDHVQARVGISDFSATWEVLRKKTTAKRAGRREVRNRLAVADPQAFAQMKEKRGHMKKDSKKRKIKAFADAKQRERPTKRRA
ncbi:U3 small nucleolar RNA-associated protein 20, partial [Tremellales sp. Uapishka_1]